MITYKGFFLILVSCVLTISCEDAVNKEDITDIDILNDKQNTALVINTPSGGKFVNCIFTFPNGTEIKNPETDYLGDILYSKDCTFTPKQYWNIKLSGAYKLNLVYVPKNAENEKSEIIRKTFNINWIQTSSPDSAKIFSGQIMTLHVRRPNGISSEITSCEHLKLLSNSKKAQGKVVDGSCQVTLKDVKTTDDGFYEVLAITQQKHRLKAIFQLSVIDEKDLEKEKEKIVMLFSDNNVIKSDISLSNTLFCSLTNNNDEVVQTSNAPCEFRSQVKKSVEGEWKAKLLLEGRLEPFEQTIKVRVVEDKPFETICKNSDNGVNMLCKCPRTGDDQCIFTGPSGQIISTTEGLGNNKYAFYTDFEESTKRQQCGLNIKSLDDSDQGTWKCNIGSSCSRLIEITKDKGCAEENNNIEYTPTAPERFYVLDEDVIRGLTCSINADLEYCLFRTFLGQELLGYVDVDKQGVCILREEYKVYANNTGNWTCTLGVSTQQKEYSKDIIVQVLKSNFLPVQNEFVYKNKNVELKCLNYKYDEVTTREVSQCRFVRPDGKVVKLDPDSTLDHYVSTSKLSDGICGLKLNELKSEDVGNWTCTAFVGKKLFSERFAVSSGLILSTSIQLITLVSLLHAWCGW